MDNAKLNFNGENYEFPLITGSEGEVGIDFAELRSSTKAVGYDPGYGNTGSCSSAITFIDGEQGVLRHRGYAIEDLAEKASFPAVAYLLIYGELPSADELEVWESDLIANMALPEGMQEQIALFPKAAHPMGVVSSMLGALPGFYSQEYNDEKSLDRNMRRLMGHIAAITAATLRHVQGKPVLHANRELGYCGNFLRLMSGDSDGGYELSKTFEDAIDMLLIVHADHEQNCSTSTVRMVGSSQSNIFSCVSAGSSALWGPSHGGANQAVMEMLQRIQDDGGDYNKYMEMAKDKESGFRLMGFGHRVYKNFDPRATILKRACDNVLEELGVSDPLLDVAKGLEEVALRDEFFIARKLYPNVDFYSGILYRAMGIPVNMFTTMFTTGRMPGWIAHWKEAHDENGRIHRPRQIYTGPGHRPYTA